MEVIRSNFKEALPLISASIKKADFLAIDAEFTGLINGRDVSIFDTPEEYYSRLFHGSTEFLLIQYGLCAFYWDEKAKHYMNDAYNFYLFPRGRPGPEKIFLCQSSSLNFLAAQGFDFNKLIKDGISYVTEPTETRMRENLIERQKIVAAKEKENIIIPGEHKQQVESVCKKVRQFIDENKLDELEVDRCNAFVRLLLYQELKVRFKDEVLVETKVLDNQNRVLLVRRITEETDPKQQEEMRKERQWEELEDVVGFSKVARMISQSEKLVIGHNMLLDVIHTLNHFFQPLTSDYVAFKEFAHCMFPRILDTKYMSSRPPFRDMVNSNVLPHLLATLCEPPFSLPEVGSEQGRGYRRADDKQHEAGYDAYVTGLCFLAMLRHVGAMRGEPAARVPPLAAALRPFLNKIYLAKTAHQDSPYINLAGPDPTPTRDHVFHLTFPKDWQRTDINQLFSPFGPVTIQFVDECSALVALARRDQAAAVGRQLGRMERVTLLSYAQYKLNNTNKIGAEEKPPAPATSPLKEGAVTPVSLLPPAVPAVAPLPQELRARANSDSGPVPTGRPASGPAPTSRPARKRTSSGVFLVDSSEPPVKKSELPTRQSDDKLANRPQLLPKGRRKQSESDIDKVKVVAKEQKIDKVRETFDKPAKSNCVTAFEESDCWE